MSDRGAIDKYTDVELARGDYGKELYVVDPSIHIDTDDHGSVSQMDVLRDDTTGRTWAVEYTTHSSYGLDEDTIEVYEVESVQVTRTEWRKTDG